MGSPVSPIVANLFMEDYEGKALEAYQDPSKYWGRYIDDALAVIKTANIEPFHTASESYSLEKLHPVSSKMFKYYFIINMLVTFLQNLRKSSEVIAPSSKAHKQRGNYINLKLSLRAENFK